MDRLQLLQRVNKAWLEFKESHAGLSDSRILEPGVQGRWPEELLTMETRFRRRLRLDAYGHYPKHARAIRVWRERVVDGTISRPYR